MSPEQMAREDAWAAMLADGEELTLWSCPVCGGDVEPMGCLGALEYGRCRQCGAELCRHEQDEADG